MVVMFYTVSIAVLWYVRIRSCRSFAYTWYGLLPLQVRLAPILQMLALASILYSISQPCEC